MAYSTYTIDHLAHFCFDLPLRQHLDGSFPFRRIPNRRNYRPTATPTDNPNKKLSYRLGTARRESLPKIAEMDVENDTGWNDLQM